MNKKIYQNQDIQNELDGSVFFSGKQKSGSPHKENKTDVVTSSNDVITSPTDVTTGKKKKTTTTHNSTPHSLDVAKLQTIISAIAEVPTTA